ncbi:PREDICTED: solute carrier family 25 member 51 [Acromyrmex echinatior]|uniref:Mitochondrial carrier triple repeat protein 1 n=1 Tax=Acromyrmex echinatior TaxID=103372 RepID=F4WV83_ACREC|nr:PREDICTED: solute carrier family 25 member 51 [Acromyrmex echinatior]XP_011060286.1 PREDICTED: solute carrier family 25 member 51 [Acromyrmex echinatior]XP_011060287.1 PREDICTED: solute carrier family 25 member 51 [Acromyrmex echinatior]EGI61849.1 Mitochondrial carrier triple repeat protein 1 [Acromyrmex echinatior]
MSNVTSEKIPLHSVLRLNNSDVKEFFCGWGAAVINVSVTYPINKITFRQILEGVPVDAAIGQMSQEGIRLLYRGILPPLCQKTLSLSLMFSIYEGCKQRLCLLTANDVLSKILAANVAGTVEALFMPFERVQTLLQDWRYHKKFKNTSHAFRYLLSNHGVTECYRGMVPIIYRNGLSNLMFFTLRDQSKILLGEKESLLTNFISGALIGGFTSTVFYPINVIKIHMQSKIGGDYEKFLAVTREIYISRNRSLTSFYKGVHLNYMRSFISWGVINASHDFLKKIIF